jgi:hypothetical protein
MMPEEAIPSVQSDSAPVITDPGSQAVRRNGVRAAPHANRRVSLRGRLRSDEDSWRRLIHQHVSSSYQIERLSGREVFN